MPGVPSGRGCDACRHQKKKCDQSIPECSRCRRLGVTCIGSGLRRYKFQEQNGFPMVLEGQQKSIKVSSNKKFKTTFEFIPYALSNRTSVLASALIKGIKSTTDLRYNLTWTYGGFLKDIPQRLGTSEALDASIDALVGAHSQFCSNKEMSVDVLTKYSLALNKLRLTLDDPIMARTSETLGAVMVLMICQSFISGNSGQMRSHCEGAAQILKTRGNPNPQDEFESKVLLCMRGPVVFEGVWNPNIQFSVEEWKEIVENHLDKDNAEGKMMGCLAKIPNFLHRGKLMQNLGITDQNLLEEIRITYQDIREVLEDLRIKLELVEGNEMNGVSLLDPIARAHAYAQRRYGLAVTVAVLVNRVLIAMDVENYLLLLAESTFFSQELIAIARCAKIYRPLGAAYVLFCLGAAWVATNDVSMRLSIRELISEYQSFYPHQCMADLESTERHLDLISQHLRLIDFETDSMSMFVT